MPSDASKDLLWNDKVFSQVPLDVKQITQVFATQMVYQAGLEKYPRDAPLNVLDAACGPAIVAGEVHKLLKTSQRPQTSYSITCGDFADAMVDAAQDQVNQNAWSSNTKVLKMDCQDTNLPGDQFTHIFTNFGPMLYPDPDKALAEGYRMTQPGGIYAFTTWKRVGWVDDTRDAFKSMPEYPQLPETDTMATIFKLKGWNNPVDIEKRLAKHKFENVRVEAMSHKTRAADKETVAAFMARIIPIVQKSIWTEEQRQEHSNRDVLGDVVEWFDRKYAGAPVEWDWVAMITTSVKPKAEL